MAAVSVYQPQLPLPLGSATGGHWSVLRTLLSRCPPEELPECLRVVSHKLLSSNVALPQWMVELFQVS